MRRAFTLIELLVVMGVIAILAGLLMPAVSHARHTTRRMKCRSNLHNIGVAMRMYLNQSNDVMPIAAQLPSLHLNDYPRIVDILSPFLQSTRVFACPEDTVIPYFTREGASYEYASMLGGRRVNQSFLTQRFGEQNTPVLYDYESFHGPAGALGARNYLFADGHVGDLKGE